MDKGIINAISRHDIVRFADLAAILQKYCAMESAWKTQTNFWDNPALTKPFVRTKRANSHKLPESVTKKTKAWYKAQKRIGGMAQWALQNSQHTRYHPNP